MSPYAAQPTERCASYWDTMRRPPGTPLALGRQLAEWRRPLDDDPVVEEAVMRMLRSLDRHLQGQQQPGEASSSAAAAS
jgi:hypothetical protein